MYIYVNGVQNQVSDKTTLLDVKNHFNKDADVMILNGFQTPDDMQIKEGDNITLIKKGEMPPFEVLENLMMARHTPTVHNKVKSAKVGIAGLGGLGSNIAIMLARTGVGYLVLVDFDIVEPSNLNRQSYYISHLGMYKADALKEQIKQINPFITVEAINIKVDETNIKQLFEGCDIVCEAFDNPQAKAMLVSCVLSEMQGTKVVSGSGMAGYESANTIKTIQSMKNFYICGDGETEAKVGRGLMAPRVNVCAGHQANMVLRLILGINNVD